MFFKIAGLFGAGLISLVFTSASFAQQYRSNDGRIVHSRLAPVMMHRAVPPYRGVHVYDRQELRRSR